MKIGLIVLVLFIAFCNAFSYWNMRCPSQSEWGVISSWVCNGTETKKYTCLYNAIRRKYEESCKFQPVISGNGSQYVISVYPNSEPCRNYDRYQPFPLGSNAGSDCVFQKSTCSEEGNILFHHGSPKTDLSCRCNFQKGFSFVNEIPNRCDCIPSQEDCSCYLKQCPLGHRLISDYACLHEDDRKHIVKCPEMGPDNSRKMTTHLRQLSSKELKNIEFLNRRIDFIGLTCLTGICIVYAIVVSLLIITNKIPKMCYFDICPYNLEITPDGSSLRISWSISDKVPTIDILGYKIHYIYNGQWEQFDIGKDEQFLFDDLVPSKTYRFKVSACLRNEIESKCSEEKTFNTESLDTCPFDLIIETVRSSLLIAWSISDKVPTIDILCYIIYYTYDGKWKHFYVIDDTECSFNKLKPSKTYRFKVAACFSDRVESKCTQEKKFITKLPIKPKVEIPNGENSKIILTWNSPRNTLIQIEGYEIQWFIDEGPTIADKKIVASNVFRHEIETVTEGVTYRIEICSFSNSVKSLYEDFPPFTTRHDTFTMEVTYDIYDQKDKVLVQNNVNERFKHTCKGFPGDQKKIHQSESEGSIVITIMFISEGFNDEKVLHDTLKNTFQKKMIGSDTIKFKSFWLKRLNDPSPPQQVKASRVDNGVLVSWKEPFITFFKTIEYVVEYMEDDWTSPQSIVVPVDKNSYFITKVLPSANIQVKVYTCICHLIRSSPSSVVSTVDKDAINDSIWLCKVLEDIGASDDYRKICQEKAITIEIIHSFTCKFTAYEVGSRFEGTVTPGVTCDQDGLLCDETLPVIENMSKADTNTCCLLILREPESPAGYVKLQLVVSGVPCMLKHLSFLYCFSPSIKHYIKPDRSERVVLFDLMNITEEDLSVVSRSKNIPAIFNFFEFINTNTVVCYRCKSWPSFANEWISRYRCYGWPTITYINDLISLGFFVVKKGHPFSLNKDLEWRISFYLQERQLVRNLTDVQYKCYVVLKMLNRDILQLDCIRSYHWKTCLFYTMEENEEHIWENKLLFHCVQLCIKRMLMWVKLGFCPNYFIPADNIFEGENIDCLSEIKLVELLNVGFDCLLQVQTNNLCDFIRSRNNVKGYERLRKESKKTYQTSLYMKKVDIYHCAMFCSSRILDHYRAYKNITDFIDFLWQTLDKIQHVGTDSEHTPQETQRALSILKPFLYTSLASNISAMCIKQTNPSVRDFLLYGCYTFFMKGDLPGRLKFISVLYALGCYKECKWYLDQENEEYITYNPSVCACHNMRSDLYPLDFAFNEMSQFKMSTCITFLPTEFQIMPGALKIEMFRHMGIKLHDTDLYLENFRWCWHYWTVVDSNVYYYFLKFLTNRKIKGVELSVDSLLDIYRALKLLFRLNIRHLDVFYNLMAWCFRTVGLMHIALDMSRMAWNIPRPLDALMLLHPQEIIKKHNHFNSAKIHSLIILYNIWFTKKPSSNNFCFGCFLQTPKTIYTCYRCKTATYCSNQCKNKNKSVHKAVCEIVRRYGDVKETILYERI